MIQIDDKIISLDIFEKHFVCDLNSCKGACCVEGDSGAPITSEENDLITTLIESIKPYMRSEGIAEINLNGVGVFDKDGDLTTTLVNNKECAFVTFKEGIAKCSIEHAFLDGKINFKKPISCNLFPIRIKEYDDFDAINYEKIRICQPACDCGSKLKIPLFTFLKEPLIKKYGSTWYSKLLEAAKLLRDSC